MNTTDLAKVSAFDWEAERATSGLVGGLTPGGWRQHFPAGLDVVIRTRIGEYDLLDVAAVTRKDAESHGGIDGADVMFAGTMDLDGCLDTNVGRDRAMNHFCGPQDADTLARALKCVWQIALTEMPERHWTLDANNRTTFGR